ncbi:MAG: hypothetical protein GKR93_00635 [Gammaproteobacteria bacterium]|nr:hypothetical protein [Gammaproteobacteria bacterium]
MSTPQPSLSTRQLVLSLLVAMLLGVGLAMLIVLPAEKGEDPTGFGALTGVDKLSEPEVVDEIPLVLAPVEPVSNEDALYIRIDPIKSKAVVNEFGEPQPFVDGANIRQHEQHYKGQLIEIKIDTDEQVEYKALMEEGDVLLYFWEADAELYFDFHAHQDTGDPNFFTRYAEGEGKSDHGSIVAPYSGQHGWYWLNIAGKPVTVQLGVSGYYDEIIEIDMKAEAE